MCRGFLPLALGSVWIVPGALAQDRSALPPGAVVQSLDDGGAGAELRRNLTLLAQNPRSVTALNGAGAAALEMGDADAALNFFQRASDADPSSARAKAGMASCLVRLERASEALPLFTEAVRMGAPEVEIAADRGLAWDSLGFPARAQADYALALRREDDPEVRRRLALSLAISGQRAEALRVIDGQLQANDRAAWRTQAFILALTGDASGAGQTARNMMPGAADALTPFLQRLAGLSPSQKAMAVHFGHFPSDGRAQQYAQADSVADPGAVAMAQGSVPMGRTRVRSRLNVATSPLEAGAPRRRPDTQETSLAAQIRPAPARARDAAPRRQYSAPSFAELETRRVDEPRVAQGGPPPAQPQYASAQSSGPAPAWATPVLDERQTQQYPSRPPAPAPRPAPNEYERQDDNRSPGFTLVPQGRPFGRPAEVRPQPQPQRPLSDFSTVASVVNSLEEEGRTEAAPPVEDIAPPVRTQPARTTRSAATRPTPTPPARTRQPPAQANPSREWVQLATGTNRAGMIFTYGQFRQRASGLLSGRAPYMATNRLLVGPFPTEAAAGAFARQLAARGVQAHSWTSDAGQRIDQLQAASDEPRSSTRTAQTERASSGTRSARNGTRSGRNGTSSVRDETVSTTSRNGRASRSGTSSRNERSAASSGASSSRNRNGTNSTRNGGGSSSSSRNGTATGSRSGRSGTATTRSAGSGASRDRTPRGQKPPAPTSTRSTRASRGGSAGQSRTSPRRGR